MIHDELRDAVSKALISLGFTATDFTVEHPAEQSHGDYSTNVALVLSKSLKSAPRVVADTIVTELKKQTLSSVTDVSVAGAGFINFRLSPEYFSKEVQRIKTEKNQYGKNNVLSGKKVMVEYTDPNPFKEFHIGHLMSNAIGESLARIYEYSGATVIRACWQGDVGLHVAKALWGILKDTINFPHDTAALPDKVAFLGRAYVLGARMYEEDDATKKEIDEINKKIYDASDADINNFYKKGRAWSLEHFEELYKLLGTKFDFNFFEGTEGRVGEEIVRTYLSKGVFEKSDGAVVFKGEKFGLHTRVFITSQGLPTYEAKEIGLTKAKFDSVPDIDTSIVVTANEQDDYFKVVLKAIEQIYPAIAKRTRHISHGMMRFASGKMSSRTGNVITGESLLQAMKNLVFEKMQEREMLGEEKQRIAEIVAVGAIKYSILKQGIGSDIIYDFDKSISFDGDSGPYLQYAYTRAMSVLEKARKETLVAANVPEGVIWETTVLEKLLVRFSEVIVRSYTETAPQLITTYLTELASVFNGFYAKEKIVDTKDSLAPYRLSLVDSFAIVMKNGLKVLGIEVPEKM